MGDMYTYSYILGWKSGICQDEDKLCSQYGGGAGDLRGEGVLPHVTDIGERRGRDECEFK